MGPRVVYSLHETVPTISELETLAIPGFDSAKYGALIHQCCFYIFVHLQGSIPVYQVCRVPEKNVAHR